jgi:hypothetical protein
MKQELLRGFGASYLTGATAPLNMPDDVVTLCVASDSPEASAIRLCIQYAKRRFGYRQIDIARLCGWTTDSHLSSYAKGAAYMPVKHYDRFAQVTGCSLLEQVQQRIALNARLDGKESENKREEAALMLMLGVAA